MTKQIRLKDGLHIITACSICSFQERDLPDRKYCHIGRMYVDGYNKPIHHDCPLEDYVEEPVTEQMMICENAARCPKIDCSTKIPHRKAGMCDYTCVSDVGIKGSRCVPYKPEKPLSEWEKAIEFQFENLLRIIEESTKEDSDKEAQKVINTVFQQNIIDLRKRLEALEQHRIPSLEELVSRKYHECRKD